MLPQWLPMPLQAAVITAAAPQQLLVEEALLHQDCT
jgi:hypothetical protein